jgi:hypothetical protein
MPATGFVWTPAPAWVFAQPAGIMWNDGMLVIDRE